MKTVDRLLSLVLRHKPEEIGITLDANGWVLVSDLLKALKSHNMETTFAELEEIVKTNNKQRFAFNDNKTKIRANQGHSLQVDLQLKEQQPPDILYHGTAFQFLKSIKQNGLLKMNRHHVHLSTDIDTATKVGDRHGDAKILTIDSYQMYKDGFKFYKTSNNVWLTDSIPTKYITI
jgi:putative RNA 2'-phosphotransferase